MKYLLAGESRLDMKVRAEAIVRVEVDAGRVSYPLQAVHIEDFPEPSRICGTPTMYAHLKWGTSSGLKFWPVPAKRCKIRVIYIPAPVEL